MGGLRSKKPSRAREESPPKLVALTATRCGGGDSTRTERASVPSNAAGLDRREDVREHPVGEAGEAARHIRRGGLEPGDDRPRPRRGASRPPGLLGRRHGARHVDDVEDLRLACERRRARSCAARAAPRRARAVRKRPQPARRRSTAGRREPGRSPSSRATALAAARRDREHAERDDGGECDERAERETRTSPQYPRPGVPEPAPRRPWPSEPEPLPGPCRVAVARVRRSSSSRLYFAAVFPGSRRIAASNAARARSSAVTPPVTCPVPATSTPRRLPACDAAVGPACAASPPARPRRRSARAPGSRRCRSRAVVRAATDEGLHAAAQRKVVVEREALRAGSPGSHASARQVAAIGVRRKRASPSQHRRAPGEHVVRGDREHDGRGDAAAPRRSGARPPQPFRECEEGRERERQRDARRRPRGAGTGERRAPRRSPGSAALPHPAALGSSRSTSRTSSGDGLRPTTRIGMPSWR